MKRWLRVFSGSIGRMLPVVAIVTTLVVESAQPMVAATQIDIVGPAGSGVFGTSVTALPNGNIVVTDPDYDAGATENVGAVYLYDGATAALISALTGSTTGDQVGSGGVTVLANGNYLVLSPGWNNGSAAAAGAVTWGNGATGISGVVSAANSLVGSRTGDQVGSGGVTVLNNGNYLVSSPTWDNGAVSDAGAVTWGNGAVGVKGVVSAANSLVGSRADDQVGYTGTYGPGVIALTNDNYVVSSPRWDNGAMANAGAATWGSGTAGVKGPVSAANSLIGGAAADYVAYGGAVALHNGNYVVLSPGWDNGGPNNIGAVTWGNGATGIVGVVSAANSLVGSTAGDWVGDGTFGVAPLSNGNYVVSSPDWDNGAVVDAGAVTWGDGTTGTAGVVSAANSLVGSTNGDRVGIWGVTILSNGNYVVGSPYWDNGAVGDSGAATWGNGATGTVGVVSTANSLVGSSAGNWVGLGVAALTNGNYVVSSPKWANGAVLEAGAATWGDGATGTVGVVSAANSLVGSTASDSVGGVTALSNGNYVVVSNNWNNGAVAKAGAVTWGDGTTGIVGVVSAANSLVGTNTSDHVGGWGVTALSNGNYIVGSANWNDNAGAVTWGDGTTGIVGAVSAANSLVGSTDGDQVGSDCLTALSNGNYVVCSQFWSNGAIQHTGAVTWGDGTTGIVGAVSAANSLVGSTAGDWVGGYGAAALPNGHYVVSSPFWNNGGLTWAGAATWGNGTTGTVGPLTADNSVRGAVAFGGAGLIWAYDYANRQLVVGRPAENIVTLFRPDLPVFPVFLPIVLKNTP